jgi:hypothetical protein
MSWYRAPLWDLRPDITSCHNVAVLNLRSCFCGAPSLRRGRLLRAPPQLGGQGSRIYIPQEKSGPVIPSRAPDFAHL